MPSSTSGGTGGYPLHRKHRTSSSGDAGTHPVDMVPCKPLDQWLALETLSDLCVSVFREFHDEFSVSRFLIVSSCPGRRCRWAVAPADQITMEQISRWDADFSIPVRSGLHDIGGAESSEGLDPRIAEMLQTLRVPHHRCYRVTATVGFHVAWASDRPMDTVVHSGLWRALELTLANYARREDLLEASHIDPTARVFNRRHFNQRLIEEAERARRFSRPLSLLVLDLDRFKALNDARGHLAGDIVMRYIAQTIRRSIRSIDVLCRIGGDEFAVLMPDTASEDCHKLGDRLCRIVAAREFLVGGTGEPVVLSTSVGGANHPADAKTGEGLLWCADMALLIAKKEGGNQFQAYHSSMRNRLTQYMNRNAVSQRSTAVAEDQTDRPSVT